MEIHICLFVFSDLVFFIKDKGSAWFTLSRTWSEHERCESQKEFTTCSPATSSLRDMPVCFYQLLPFHESLLSKGQKWRHAGISSVSGGSRTRLVHYWEELLFFTIELGGSLMSVFPGVLHSQNKNVSWTWLN